MNQPLFLSALGKLKQRGTFVKRAFIVADQQYQLQRLMQDCGYGICDKIEKADIVVFGGGADIDPALYGETINKAARTSINPREDKRDKEAYDKVKSHQLKVGICRGGQYLNVMSGGKMYQNVNGHASNHVMYDALFRTTFMVTSHHHQQMIAGPEGEVIGYTEKIGSNFYDQNGEVAGPSVEPEIIYYPNTKSLCVQSHPEWANITSSEFKHFKKLMQEFA